MGLIWPTNRVHVLLMWDMAGTIDLIPHNCCDFYCYFTAYSIMAMGRVHEVSISHTSQSVLFNSDTLRPKCIEWARIDSIAFKLWMKSYDNHYWAGSLAAFLVYNGRWHVHVMAWRRRNSAIFILFFSRFLYFSLILVLFVNLAFTKNT